MTEGTAGSARNLRGAMLIEGLTLVGLLLLIALGVVNAQAMNGLRLELQPRITELEEILKGGGNKPPPAAAAAPVVEADALPAGAETLQLGDESSPAIGPAKAPIVLAEFSDFQCGPCGTVRETVETVQLIYGDQVRVIFMHRPLPEHAEARLAHLASMAAHEQGRFWEYAALLYRDPARLGRDDLIRYARELGLDTGRFVADLDSPRLAKEIDSAVAEADQLGVTATPTFFVNGRFFEGAHSIQRFLEEINTELVRLELPIPPAATVVQPRAG